MTPHELTPHELFMAGWIDIDSPDDPYDEFAPQIRGASTSGKRCADSLRIGVFKNLPSTSALVHCEGGDVSCCLLLFKSADSMYSISICCRRCENWDSGVSGSFPEQDYQQKTSMNKQHVRLWLEVKNRCQGPCGRNSQSSWMVSTLLQEVAYSFVLGRGHDLDGNVQLWTSSFWSTCGKTDSRVGKTMRVNPNFDHIWNISAFKNCSKPSPRPLWHGTGADAARLPCTDASDLSQRNSHRCGGGPASGSKICRLPGIGSLTRYTRDIIWKSRSKSEATEGMVRFCSKTMYST